MKSLQIILGKKLYQKVENVLKNNDNNLSNALLNYISFDNCDLSDREVEKINALCELEYLYKSTAPTTQILQSKDVAKFAQPKIGNQEQEHILVLALNNANKILSSKVINVGSLTACVVCKKTLFSYLMSIKNCNAFVICHNHPSGNLNPSQADRLLTEDIYKGGKILGFKLLDHVIVSHSSDYYSFGDEGELW